MSKKQQNEKEQSFKDKIEGRNKSLQDKRRIPDEQNHMKTTQNQFR